MADPLDVDGPAAPPRDNGELHFDAPWQGRAFALVVALHEADQLPWDDFRRRLIAELADEVDAAPATYWGAWLRAAEDVLGRRGLVPPAARTSRLAAYAARPTGHDHGDHGHPHHHDSHAHGHRADDAHDHDADGHRHGGDGRRGARGDAD